MTKSALIAAGWLSVVYAVLDIPTLLLAVFAQDVAGVSGGKFIEVVVDVVSITLFICLMLRVKQFLNQNLNFHETDNLVDTIIRVNAVIVGIDLISIVVEPLESLVLWLSIIAMIGLGVVGTVFAIKLLALPQDAFGLLKPYAYTMMAASILSATVILIPFGILAGIASSIILAILFFRASEQAQPAQTSSTLTL